MNRRHFLVAASAAAQSWAGANDRVRVAIIGVGSRGSGHIREILPGDNLEIATVVDVDGRRTEAAASGSPRTGRVEQDSSSGRLHRPRTFSALVPARRRP